MHLHLVELGVAELIGFVEDVIGHRELPDIVKQRSGPQRLDLRLAQTEQSGEPGRVNLNAMDMIVGDFVLGVDGDRQCFDRSQVQVSHLFDVTNRGLNFLEIVFVRQKSYGQHRDCNYEGVKGNNCYQFHYHAGADSTGEV